MKLALNLAKRGELWVSPNPLVGALVVMEGRVISKGYHRRFGGEHAEVEALAPLEEDLRQATLYVTLEPCCHWGKTPPCTELILRKGVGRVVVGTLDPNPRVCGRGVQILREAGVEVKVGVLEDECRQLNHRFFHWMERGLPWVTLKWAQSMDGRIATASGHSRWISSLPSRRRSHRFRSIHDAVLVGVGTVVKDDPRLTVRHVKGRNPVRIILDSRLRIPDHAKVLDSRFLGGDTWIVTTPTAPAGRSRTLESRGVRVLSVEADPSGRVDLRGLLRLLVDRGISSILVEGGAQVLTSFLKARLVQRILCFVAPLILGDGIEAVGKLAVERVDQGIRFRQYTIQRSGDEVLVDCFL